MEEGLKKLVASGMPVEPRRHSLATHSEVMELAKAMEGEEGYEVTHDQDAGTITARFYDTPVYKGIQKGDSDQPWIVTYATEYFGGAA
jgi:hypothetical protein